MDYGRTTERNAAMRHIPIKVSGVYKITNNVDGRIYIGASHNIRKRLRAHLETLRRSEHPSSNLQTAYDEFGESAFSFEVLELCLADRTLEREQVWLTSTRCFEPAIGYNICDVAGPPPKLVYTPEMREAMSRRRKGVPKSADHRKKIGEAHKGKAKSPEAIAKQREALKAFWARPENRAKQSAKRKGCVAHNKGVPHTAEARAKIAAHARSRAATPEGKAALKENLRKMNSPEAQTKAARTRSANMTGRSNLKVRIYSDEQIAEWKRMKSEGMTLSEISKATGIGKHAIHYWT